ncbi:TPA: hypothetical protein HA244_01920 [Candidatus Micrarchaeota archaeon]|nr:hypothetical protein [Candidatus Micrarchaeota archaeon]
MKTIIFVTSNKGKTQEVKKILKGLRVSVKPIDLREAKHFTHEQLVRKKAKDAFKIVGKPVVIEDTGLFVEGFKNYPGLRSREVIEKIGLKKFARKCGGHRAFFRTIAAYCDGNRLVLFKGICQGKIAKAVFQRKIPHLPFLGVFVPKGESKPVAAFSKKELEKFLVETNHRAKAFRKFEKWFSRSRGKRH